MTVRRAGPEDAAGDRRDPRHRLARDLCRPPARRDDFRPHGRGAAGVVGAAPQQPASDARRRGLRGRARREAGRVRHLQCPALGRAGRGGLRRGDQQPLRPARLSEAAGWDGRSWPDGDATAAAAYRAAGLWVLRENAVGRRFYENAGARGSTGTRGSASWAGSRRSPTAGVNSRRWRPSQGIQTRGRRTRLRGRRATAGDRSPGLSGGRRPPPPPRPPARGGP